MDLVRLDGVLAGVAAAFAAVGLILTGIAATGSVLNLHALHRARVNGLLEFTAHYMLVQDVLMLMLQVPCFIAAVTWLWFVREYRVDMPEPARVALLVRSFMLCLSSSVLIVAPAASVYARHRMVALREGRT